MPPRRRDAAIPPIDAKKVHIAVNTVFSGVIPGDEIKTVIKGLSERPPNFTKSVPNVIECDARALFEVYQIADKTQRDALKRELAIMAIVKEHLEEDDPQRETLSTRIELLTGLLLNMGEMAERIRSSDVGKYCVKRLAETVERKKKAAEKRAANKEVFNGVGSASDDQDGNGTAGKKKAKSTTDKRVAKKVKSEAKSDNTPPDDDDDEDDKIVRTPVAVDTDDE